MTTISVKTSTEYEVIIDVDLHDRAGAYIHALIDGEIAAIVTDRVVSALYLDRLLKSLHKKGFETPVFTLDGGEASKNAYNYISLIEFLADHKLSRSDVVIALGGGVVGDITGFAAATYLRGIPYVQMPTTLLAAVDASVGGKAGVDIEAGKNLIGTIYQPRAVLCDCALLEALPPSILTDGCAEIIKYGAILDRELFCAMKAFPRINMEDIIGRCVQIKADIVSADEYETGRRKILNFGHTVGHAIELLSNYHISHGKAVSIGMAIETRAAWKMGVCDQACYDELIELLHQFGLPYRTGFSAGEISRAALMDKKRKGDKITLVFPEKIGTPTLRKADVVDLEEIIDLGLVKSGENA
ncbi:MAG: 3-dehydroquinate synthase [Oscillospiraceae bacterium]|nr:3-dehydroquinate synthase [Oscillospiraceae bacterium]